VIVSHLGKQVRVTLTRAKFEELTAGLLERTMLFTRMTIEEAKAHKYNTIDQILLVGGSTKMPQICTGLEENFHLPLRIFEPDEAVAKGAAIYAQKLLYTQYIQTRAAEISERAYEDVAIEKVNTDVLEQAQIDVARELGIKEQSLKRLAHTTITNVTSHSFGILATIDYDTPQQREVIENMMFVNDPLPTFRMQNFGTLEAGQEVVELHIMENSEKTDIVEPELFTPESEIGKVILPLPADLPPNSPIEVTFELNQQGRLHVIGREPHFKRTVEATFETRGGLTDAELQQAKSRVSDITIL